MILVTGLVLLPTDTNIAAGALPGAWKPYLWLAWPAEAFLAGVLVYAEVRDKLGKQRPPAGADGGREQLARACDDLADAVQRQWSAESGLRLLHSPEPIRVAWQTVGRPVGADIAQVVAEGAVAGRPLEGRGDTRDVLKAFRGVRAGQMVLLGEPAAGKSTMAMLLTIDLLGDRPPGGPVPVLLTASSWNPRREGLYRWLARRVDEEYPALANAGAYGPGAAMRLLTGGLIVPVLDGLDEMPEVLQPAVISAIEQAVSAGRNPLVITCRTPWYQAAVKQNGRLLAHAAALELKPLDLAGATEFLCGAAPARERWQAVLDSVSADPGCPAGQALRSPLMVDLARTVYATSDEEPAGLLDTARFPDCASVEQHLLGEFVRVAYCPVPPGSRPGRELRRYPAERADRWLRFLAATLNPPDASAPGSPGTDLAWWQLFRAARPVTRILLGGLGAALAAGIVMGLSAGPAAGIAYALTFGPAAGLTYGYGQPRKPSRIQVKLRGNGLSLLRRLAVSLAVGAATGHPLSGAIVFAVLAAHLWWTDTPADTATASSPMDLLKQDRQAALVLGAVLCAAISPGAAGGFMAGAADFPVALGNGAAAVAVAVSSGAAISAVIGLIMGSVLSGRTGAIAFGAASAAVSLPVMVSARVLGTSYDKIIPPHPGLAAGIAFGSLLGWLAVMSASWGSFVPAQAWLALRGDLPWRPMRFLDDAHKRGILRQAGTVYQFRHERLREHLAPAGNPRPEVAAETAH